MVSRLEDFPRPPACGPGGPALTHVYGVTSCHSADALHFVSHVLQCPVYDLDYDVEFNGVYQSMTKKAAITLQVRHCLGIHKSCGVQPTVTYLPDQHPKEITAHWVPWIYFLSD